MRIVRAAPTAVSVVWAIGAFGLAFPSAAAAGAGTGCPGGAWQVRTVESLAATGNAPVPGRIDAAGNADGLVCALPLPDAVCESQYDPCPVAIVYQYQDNVLPR
jgi:hypothetical protein